MQDGIINELEVDDEKWCCKSTEDHCITTDYGKNVVCNGTAINLSEQCLDEKSEGPTCNYYPLDNKRNPNNAGVAKPYYRSYVDLCQDNSR